MTLDEFMRPDQRFKNQWLEHPEFSGLYVRKSRMIYFHKGDRRDKKNLSEKIIQLSNLAAKEPGKGAFTRLLAHIQETYPDYVVYVENVLEDRFARHLKKIGFVEISLPLCYILEPKGK